MDIYMVSYTCMHMYVYTYANICFYTYACKKTNKHKSEYKHYINKLLILNFITYKWYNTCLFPGIISYHYQNIKRYNFPKFGRANTIFLPNMSTDVCFHQKIFGQRCVLYI